MVGVHTAPSPESATQHVAPRLLGPGAIGQLQRVAQTMAESALEHLGRPGEDPHKALHEARRSIRATRAVLRLLRHGLGEEWYRRESAVLRDAAALLSAQRDAQVVVGAFDRLAGDMPVTAAEPAARVRAALDLASSEEGAAADDAGGAAARIRRFLGAIPAWPEPSGGDAEIVAEGLRRCVRRARRRYRDAAADPTPERLHELRKRSKDVREQLRVLKALKPGKFRKLQARYDKVCDALGEDRDLHLLDESIALVSGEIAEAADLIAAVRRAGAERRAKLAEKGLRWARKATRISGRELATTVRDRWARGVG